jgi:hypothetical protein
MGVRARLAWMVRGGPATNAALDSLSVDLRALQHRVDELATALGELRGEMNGFGARQLDEFDTIRAAVAAATDDLMARVEAVDARVRGSS